MSAKKWTEDLAYQTYVDYAGKLFEYTSYEKNGKQEHVIGYDILENGMLVFIMRGGTKVPYEMFQSAEMMMCHGGDIDNFVPLRRGNAGKTQDQKVAEELDLMTEEEEREFIRRKNGYAPPPPQQARTVDAQEVSTNPIYLILNKRKDKPLISIPLFIDIEFLSAQTFTLIDSTFSDSVEDITKYFMDKVNFDSMKEEVEKGIKTYIKTKYLGMTQEQIDEEESMEIIQVEAEEYDG